MVEKMYEISMLYDFYGELLTPRQKSIMQYYYEENYSLGEIAVETGVSRQAVYDAVRKAEKSLHSYEEKLGLVKRFIQTESDIEKAEQAIDEIISQYPDERAIVEKLVFVKNILGKLEE